MEINELERECKSCDLYNRYGCANKKGTIICSTRNNLIKYHIANKKELPYNWKKDGEKFIGGIK